MNDAFDALLPDTSAWVTYLRPRGAADLKTAMRDALAQGRVATCKAVTTELLVGSKDLGAFNTLLEALRGVADVSITEERWEEAARLGWDLRRQGLLVSLPDLLIAQCAISSGRVVWHVDEDFERIRERSSLRTRHWRAAN